MGVQLSDGTTNNVIDATSKGALVQNPKVVTQAGYAATSAIRDTGSVTGSISARAADISDDNRQRVGLDTLLYDENFQYSSNVNTAIWLQTLATFTNTLGSGYWTINNGLSTAANAYCALSTYRVFPIFTGAGIRGTWKAELTQAYQANNACWMGFFINSQASTAPTDGIYFQVSNAGVLTAVANANGTTLASATLTQPSSGAIHQYSIVISEEGAEFWIDSVLQATLTWPSGVGNSALSATLPFCIHLSNQGGIPSTAQALRFYSVSIWQNDFEYSRPYPHQQASMGLMSLQNPPSAAGGLTALYGNSSNPTAAVPTNTTAALSAGLGGNFWETASLAVNTDGIISSYQTPSPGIGTRYVRNLVITGVRWYSMVQTVLAGGPFVYQCGIAFGHTAVSLATAEAATTKSPRKFPMGLYTLPATAAVGTLGASFVHTFQTPIVVQPGEFIQTIVRNIGTVGSSGTIAHHIGFEGYWE